MNHDLLTFAIIKLLAFVPLFNAPKKHVLIQVVICTALGRLCWSLLKNVFFTVRIVSKSPAKFSLPFGASMELRSKANLPCLVNLAFYCGQPKAHLCNNHAV